MVTLSLVLWTLAPALGFPVVWVARVKYKNQRKSGLFPAFYFFVYVKYLTIFCLRRYVMQTKCIKRKLIISVTNLKINL